MKIYRFRSLTNKDEYSRLKQIIETGKFWCSNFWELNDPMEGVFSVYTDSDDVIGVIYAQKKEYKICSFSGKKGFKNPLLWGYYANGFKGVAVEVNIKDNEKYNEKYNDIYEVDYEYHEENNNYMFVKNKNSGIEEYAKMVLLNKNNFWKHEDECRFLIKSSNNNFHKIGKITAVYFGNPYVNLKNSNPIQKNENLINYNRLKDKLIKIIKSKDGISWYDVEIIKKNKKLIVQAKK